MRVFLTISPASGTATSDSDSCDLPRKVVYSFDAAATPLVGDLVARVRREFALYAAPQLYLDDFLLLRSARVADVLRENDRLRACCSESKVESNELQEDSSPSSKKLFRSAEDANAFSLAKIKQEIKQQEQIMLQQLRKVENALIHNDQQQQQQQQNAATPKAAVVNSITSPPSQTTGQNVSIKKSVNQHSQKPITPLSSSVEELVAPAAAASLSCPDTAAKKKQILLTAIDCSVAPAVAVNPTRKRADEVRKSHGIVATVNSKNSGRVNGDSNLKNVAQVDSAVSSPANAIASVHQKTFPCVKRENQTVLPMKPPKNPIQNNKKPNNNNNVARKNYNGLQEKPVTVPAAAAPTAAATSVAPKSANLIESNANNYSSFARFTKEIAYKVPAGTVLAFKKTANDSYYVKAAVEKQLSDFKFEILLYNGNQKQVVSIDQMCSPVICYWPRKSRKNV